MSLNTLNKTVRTSSATLTGVDSKDSIVFMSRLNRDDFNIIGNYINNVAVRALRSLTSSPTYPHDALDNGISGMTVITYPEDLGNSFINSEMFWKQGAVPGTGRPCTIKESFDYVLANLTQQIVQVVERTEDITGLIEELKCAGFNNLTIKNEVLGQNYPLLCNGETIGSYPIAKHIYELFNQVIGGHNIENLEYLDNGDTTYPNLTFALPEIVVSDASETVKGLVELATVAEVIAGTSGVFSITPDKLVSAIQGNGILRDKIKLAALEQINESSVFELSDVNNPNTLEAKQSLLFDSTSNKFINRRIVWDDIQMRPAVTEPILYSETQNSSIVNTKQDYAENDKVALLKSHNTLSYKKESGKWEIEKYKSYKGLSPAKSYGVDIFKSSHPLPGYVNKKVPFTVCYAYKNEIYSVSSGDVVIGPEGSLPYVQYSSELNEEVSHLDEIKDPSSRVMSSNTRFWEEDDGAIYNLGSEAVGIYRTDKTYLRDQGSYFLNPNNTENTYFSLYKNLTVDVDIMTEGESLVMVLGSYNCSDKLYACPSYINRRYGLINKEVTFCISDSYINSTDFNNYLIQEGLSNIFNAQVLSESNYIGVVTKKYNYNSSVGVRLTLPAPIGVQDFGLNISDSHNLCADLLDIDGNFSTGIQFYEFIENIWTSKYAEAKDYSNETQRNTIAKLTEFSLAYCKLKL
jgi:hypothetical protein